MAKFYTPQKRILLAAGDESNNGGNPVIYVTVLSKIPSDETYNNFGSKRTPGLDKRMLELRKDNRRSYIARTLSREDVVTNKHSLVTTVPNAVKEYLKSPRGGSFDELRVFIDGTLAPGREEEIQRQLEDCAEEVTVLTFPKPKRKGKLRGYRQPLLLGLADWLAHDLYIHIAKSEL